MMIPLSRLTKEEIGYDVPISTFRRWVATGIFPGTKVGGRWFVDREALGLAHGAAWAGFRLRPTRAKPPAPELDDRQAELPLGDVPQIEAGALEPALRDPLGPNAPGWARDAAEKVTRGEGLTPDVARALRAWMDGVDLAKEPKPDGPGAAPSPPGPYLRSWEDADAPEEIREIGQALAFGEWAAPGDFEKLQRWMRCDWPDGEDPHQRRTE